MTTTTRWHKRNTTEYEACVDRFTENGPETIKAQTFPTLQEARQWVEHQVPADLVISEGRYGHVTMFFNDPTEFEDDEYGTVYDVDEVEMGTAFYDGDWDHEGIEPA